MEGDSIPSSKLVGSDFCKGSPLWSSALRRLGPHSWRQQDVEASRGPAKGQWELRCPSWGPPSG